ncbi:MAG TPA: LLM class flavin-dependent oxidoreductase [Acetobacteraceae bacterium]|nr:LLM class flavin-dependent oxidoreductase [Acetobacteraceae bacterium]
MEFGIFHEFPSLPGRPDAAAFAEAFEIVDGAERWGLDAIWLAELHFDPERSVLSSPMCIASAIAARTQRMKIGVAVQVLPLCNPLRIAEEAATVDQISRGRLIFGVGRSGVAKTYEAYGVPYAESRDRFAETLEIIVKAWTEPVVSHQGRFHSFQDVTVTPQPFQKPLPEIRVAATSPDTFVTTGRQGRPIFLAVRHEDARMFTPQIATYREAWRAAGHPGRGQVFLRAPGYLAETEAEARRDAEPSLMHYFHAQSKLLADSAGRAGVDAADRRFRTAERLATITYEETLRGSVFIGTPDSVSAQIAGLRDDLGLDGVLIELNAGGKTPHEGVMRATRLLCQEVQPRFH